jgi:hypothetical protein
MRWTVPWLCLLLAGCGAAGDPAQPIGLPEPAEPRAVDLNWRESYGEGERRLRFEVASLEVREDGWSARIALENRTGTTFELGNRPLALAFGLMLFADGRLETLDELNRAGALPPVRKAEVIEPPPPQALAPAERWEADLSAPGSLPAGSWVRVSFGALFARGEPPSGMQSPVVWITDRTYRLEP